MTLREALRELTDELDVLRRLAYKNHSQHRRTLYFRAMKMAQRSLTKLAGFDAAPTRAAVALMEAAGSVQALLDPAIGEALVQLASALRCARAAWTRSRKAAQRLSGLLAQGFFLPFAVVALALMSRVAVLAKRMLDELDSQTRELAQLWVARTRRLAATSPQSREAAECVTLWLARARLACAEAFALPAQAVDGNGANVAAHENEEDVGVAMARAAAL